MAFRKVETRFEMLGEYWDWSVSEPVGPYADNYPSGGNKLLDTRYQRPLEGPFYHGTSEKMQPGTIIYPTDFSPNTLYTYPSGRWDSWGLDRADGNKDLYAFATKNIDVARSYAKRSQRKSKDHNRRGYIYEVEWVLPDYYYDPEDSWSPFDRADRVRTDRETYQPGRESFRSPTGWRILRLVEEMPSFKEQHPEDYS